jgi:hypothetical protein
VKFWPRFSLELTQGAAIAAGEGVETVRQLHSVDSATLRELGISPEEIEGLVYGRHDDLVRRYDPDWWRK